MQRSGCLGRAALRCVAFLTLLLSGCTALMSLQPLYEEQESATDARILGSWIHDTAVLDVTAMGSTYDVTVRSLENTESIKLQVRLIRLNGSLFFDAMTPDNVELHEHCLTCLPMHVIGRLTIEEDALRLDFFDADWIGDRAKDKGIPAARRRSAVYDALVLYADTEALRRFVEDAADEPGAFLHAEDSDPVVWRRY
jgi:hypothetical protein